MILMGRREIIDHRPRRNLKHDRRPRPFPRNATHAPHAFRVVAAAVPDPFANHVNDDRACSHSGGLFAGASGVAFSLF